MLALLTPYLFESSVQFSKQDRTSSNIPSAFCFLILVSLASFNRCSILGFLPSPITVVLCSPPGPEEKVKSYAGESLQCPSSSIKKLKFLEWSAKSVKQSYWAGLYYEQQRAKGKSHQSAVRALAYEWARIVYSCW
jgi:hypothetical protein